MPTYEYRCKNCEHEFELFQGMSDPLKRKCPKCGKNALERLIGTGAAVLFKGSGFYETDYRSETYKKAAKAETGGSSETGSASGKGEPKPDPKPSDKQPPAEKPAKNGRKDKSGDRGAKPT